jgi:hypothetical protein
MGAHLKIVKGKLKITIPEGYVDIDELKKKDRMEVL